MSNPIAEIMDTFFNGRPAPKDPKAIRVQVTDEQIGHLQNGGKLLFTANGMQIIVSLKAGRR